MSLVAYVVSRADCPELSTHLEFIELFLPKKLASTFCGYYLTVFQASTEYMINYKRETQNRESHRPSFAQSFSRNFEFGKNEEITED